MYSSSRATVVGETGAGSHASVRPQELQDQNTLIEQSPKYFNQKGISDNSTVEITSTFNLTESNSQNFPIKVKLTSHNLCL